MTCTAHVDDSVCRPGSDVRIHFLCLVDSAALGQVLQGLRLSYASPLGLYILVGQLHLWVGMREGPVRVP